MPEAVLKDGIASFSFLFFYSSHRRRRGLKAVIALCRASVPAAYFFGGRLLFDRLHRRFFGGAIEFRSRQIDPSTGLPHFVSKESAAFIIIRLVVEPEGGHVREQLLNGGGQGGQILFRERKGRCICVN